MFSFWGTVLNFLTAFSKTITKNKEVWLLLDIFLNLTKIKDKKKRINTKKVFKCEYNSLNRIFHQVNTFCFWNGSLNYVVWMAR